MAFFFVPGQFSILYSIRYTARPENDTYIQIGQVQRAQRVWRGTFRFRPNLAVIRISGNDVAARTTWLISRE